MPSPRLNAALAAAMILSSLPSTTAQDQAPNYDTIKTAHAALSSIAWVIVLPLGAVFLRLSNSRHTARLHGFAQAFGYTIVVAGGGLGIWMACNTQQLGTAHATIGLVLFSVAFFQLTGGFLQHTLYKHNHAPQLLSTAHIWLGRALITLGMINGGLGLQLAGDGSKGDYIAYGVVSGVIWLAYVTVVVMVQGFNVGTKGDAGIEKDIEVSERRN